MAAPRGVPAFRPDQLWQQASEPLFWLDSTRRLTWVNRAWEILTGHAAADVLGLICPPSGPHESKSTGATDVATTFAPPREAVNGEPTGTLTVIHRDDGEKDWKRVEYWPFHDQDGRLIGLLGQVREPSAAASAPDARSQQLRVQLLELRERLRRSVGFESLLGTGPVHARLLEQVRLAAASRVPVLIVGEPGTGKRLVGRIIHQLGPLREAPLLPLDCAAIPAELVEHELLRLAPTEEAVEPGSEIHGESVSASMASEPGKCATLLIGDVVTLPRDLQLRVSRILEHDRGIRLIATTCADPDKALLEERVRPELYHALTVLVLRIPPLRARRQDLSILAQHLLERVNHRTGVHCSGIDSQAISALQSYDWPGNVRELDRVIAAAHERATRRQLAGDRLVSVMAGDLPASIRGNLGAAYLPPPASRTVKPLDELLTEIERRLIETALSRARQNKSRAAELLGISRPRLYRRIKELNLPDEGEPEPCPAATPSSH